MSRNAALVLVVLLLTGASPGAPLKGVDVKLGKTEDTERCAAPATPSGANSGTAAPAPAECAAPPPAPTPTPMASKTICLIYQPGHQGDDRYCSQSVPAPK